MHECRAWMNMNNHDITINTKSNLLFLALTMIPFVEYLDIISLPLLRLIISPHTIMQIPLLPPSPCSSPPSFPATADVTVTVVDVVLSSSSSASLPCHHLNLIVVFTITLFVAIAIARAAAKLPPTARSCAAATAADAAATAAPPPSYVALSR